VLFFTVLQSAELGASYMCIGVLRSGKKSGCACTLCLQKSSSLKFSKSRTGSHVTYSCHHTSSPYSFPIFVHFMAFLCPPFITINHAAYILTKDTNTFA